MSSGGAGQHLPARRLQPPEQQVGRKRVLVPEERLLGGAQQKARKRRKAIKPAKMRTPGKGRAPGKAERRNRPGGRRTGGRNRTGRRKKGEEGHRSGWSQKPVCSSFEKKEKGAKKELESRLPK